MNHLTKIAPVLALVILTISVSAADAQHWEVKNPLPSLATLRVIKLIRPGVAVAAGEVGNIVVTTDGGSTWRSTIVNSKETMYRVTVTDSNTWWIMGTGGLLVRTTDGGMNWKIILQDTLLLMLYDAYFPDPLHGLVVGLRTVVTPGVVSMVPVLMRTQDGGMNWSTEFSSIEYLNSVRFIDADYGWLAGNGQLLRTTDGGSSWVKMPTPAAYGFCAPTFFDRRRGVCWASSWAGYGYHTTMFETADSGYTWSKFLDTSLYMLPPTILSETEVWSTTAYEVLHSTDGGRSWRTLPIGSEYSVYGVAIDGATLLVAGENGSIWQSTDAGQRWNRKFSGPMNVIRSVSFVDSIGWAVGGGSTWSNHPMGPIVMKSSDSGRHWDSVASPTTEHIYSVAFVTRDTGWIGCASGLILKTTDAGVQWTPQATGATRAVSQIRFLDAQNGWAVSYDGKLMWTVNGGGTWHIGTVNGTAWSMMDIWMTDLHHGIAVGAPSTFLRTIDGGLTWNPIDIPNPEGYYGVTFLDSATGFVVGAVGRILKTTDGGNTWLLSNMPSAQELHGIGFVGPDTGFAVGNAGTMFMTTNRGDSWASASTGTWNSLLRVASFPGVGGWIVGGNGTILHFAPKIPVATSVVHAFSSVPANSSLGQNYPNPFNPSTCIQFALADRQFTVIKVYDLLGREVATLVNGVMDPGTYTVQFSGAGLVSGCYFYSLTSGGHVKTLKMLLVH